MFPKGRNLLFPRIPFLIHDNHCMYKHTEKEILSLGLGAVIIFA